ncbi:MAG: JAB domain-containing protein [Terrimonas sp.]|nr:JAB domain-containing protein [Terrimonas sp.]OJY97974.1 MAG: DNA repair protein [Sphingobacteriales bacterium 40-81]
MENVTLAQDWTKVAEIEIVYKSTVKPSERPLVKDSKAAYALLMDKWDTSLIEIQEQFKVILLNRASKALGLLNLSTGSKTHTVVDSGLILATAMKAGATALLLSHNHPSGNLKPSRADLEVTQKLKMAAAYHDIRVTDHLIVTTEGYYSMAEEGDL